ncbi:MAG: ribokinase [Fulvimarina manganoxydans]|uniref:ribokinase n=1 Tax=Fulvimarina manganoxydans TaxID=937218 RepID=UPI0023553997|nr:ribokinase [Fulvimarina manganoxydans]MCK5932631.1 ribokinase [Fulvimarina manganoxydans]
MVEMRGDKPSVLVFGSLNVDWVCRVERIAPPGETVLSPTYAQLFGGKGANQAVAAARAGEDMVAVAMVGAVGEDDLGEAVIANLAENGIDTAGILRSVEPTGAAFISIDKHGENAITVASGANRAPSAASVPAFALNARTVLALQMEVPEAASRDVARLVRQAGGRTVLNLAPVPPDLDDKRLRALCESIDWLIVNESELAAAARCLDGSIDAPHDIQTPEETAALARRLSSALSVGIVATLGPRGVVAIPLAGEVVDVPALRVQAEDTTGAGDTFCGVFSTALAEGLEVKDALSRAATAASLACRKVGAQSAMPKRAEIDAALAGAADG